jgi:hypothetical protein
MTESDDRELATEDEIILARRKYASDTVEIDKGAKVSVAEKGVWVQAWVWLPNEEKN